MGANRQKILFIGIYYLILVNNTPIAELLAPPDESTETTYNSINKSIKKHTERKAIITDLKPE